MPSNSSSVLKFASKSVIFILVIIGTFILCCVSAGFFETKDSNSTKSNGTFGIGLAGYRGLVQGGSNSNQILGNYGGEDILGGAGNDVIRSSKGDDFIFGEEGDDVLEGGECRDIVLGGAGHDTIYGVDSGEFIDGGDGVDTLILPYKCRKYRVEPSASFELQSFSSLACEANFVTLKRIENIKIEPAPVQGPWPKPKLNLPCDFNCKF